MRKSYVTCPECKEQSDTEKVEFLDISSDFFGRDVMKFKCPKCKKDVEAVVYLRNY